jgi:hypothetical protein
MNSAILEKSSAIVHAWKYDRKPSLEENRGEVIDFFDKTRFEVEIKSPTPSQWNISVEYSQPRAAGYPKIGWRTNSAHAEHGQLLIER